MPNERLVMALGKLVIAAAWADREIVTEEINCLKDLLFQITELSGRQWDTLQIYVETPVGPDERARLLDDLKQCLSTTADKEFAISTLQGVCQADGVLSDDEQAVLQELGSGIEATQVGFLGAMSRLMDKALKQRSNSMAQAPNRERFLEDFVHNKIFYKLARRLESDESDIGVDEGNLRKLCAAGGLMARVAHVDDDIADEEFSAMCEALTSGWDMTPQEAALVCEVAVSEVGSGMDLHRLTREFFEATSHEQRCEFLEVLFAVAKAHGDISHDETEEIRRISRMLHVSHRDFIDAKLKVKSDA